VSGGAGLVIDETGAATPIPVVEDNGTAALSDGEITLVVTLNERVKLNQGRVETPPRETVSISGSGFQPDTGVEVWVFSDPVLLGTALVDESGHFAATLDLPASLPVGNHTVQAEGTTIRGTAKALAVGLTIEQLPADSPQLPVTGHTSDVATWSLLLIAFGALTALRLRRQHEQHP
jgi:hypothetical protein